MVAGGGWTKAGLWPALHVAVLQRLQARGDLDWSRAVIDSIQLRAEKRAMRAIPSATSTQPT
nr:hypothetical protein GCM10020063_056650 [Dactylosporangium thailandense]